MDTTPEYILECERAIKIQEDWKPAEGDYVAEALPSGNAIRLLLESYHSERQFVTQLGWVGDHEYLQLWSGRFTWLPRQDQLQDMVNEDAITMHQRMTEFILRYAYVPLGKVQPTYEQLWLRYVMREKYQKQWDSDKKEWVATPT